MEGVGFGWGTVYGAMVISDKEHRLCRWCFSLMLPGEIGPID
jgi:hypothetical protein